MKISMKSDHPQFYFGNILISYFRAFEHSKKIPDDSEMLELFKYIFNVKSINNIEEKNKLLKTLTESKEHFERLCRRFIFACEDLEEQLKQKEYSIEILSSKKPKGEKFDLTQAADYATKELKRKNKYTNQTILNWIKSGLVNTKVSDRKYIIWQSDLDEYILKNRHLFRE